MTKEEAKEAIKEAYGNSEYTDEIIETLERPKTGYWIKYDKEFYVVDRLRPVIRPIRECSECRRKIVGFCEELKYCPNCSAKMERTVRG